MDKRPFIIYCCIVVISLTTIAGSCVLANNNDPIPLKNPESLYQEAVIRINGQENIRLDISYDKSTAMGTQIFRERSRQDLTYEGLGTEHMRGYMEQTLLIGDYSISLTELYNDGTGYFTVGDSGFRGNITQEEYVSRYIPAAIVSPELYADIQGTATKTETVIHFRSGTAAEVWAAATGMTDIASEATAYLDAHGNLKKTEYLLSYLQDNTKITMTTIVEVMQAQPITLPEDPETYTPISYLDGPRKLETACGHLLMANCAAATYADTLSCEAFGDIRKQSIAVSTCNTNTWTAQVDTKITLENNSKLGVSFLMQKSETFENNTYSARIDDGPPTTGDISAAAMQSYCHDILVATIMLPEYITDAKLTETETEYRIEFAATESFAEMLSGDACTTLYQNANILKGLAQNYTTDAVSCYLTVDKTTELPTASGFYYAGTYTISELPYQLSYQADQNYDLLTTE